MVKQKIAVNRFKLDANEDFAYNKSIENCYEHFVYSLYVYVNNSLIKFSLLK